MVGAFSARPIMMLWGWGRGMEWGEWKGVAAGLFWGRGSRHAMACMQRMGAAPQLAAHVPPPHTHTHMRARGPSGARLPGARLGRAWPSSLLSP